MQRAPSSTAQHAEDSFRVTGNCAVVAEPLNTVQTYVGHWQYLLPQYSFYMHACPKRKVYILPDAGTRMYFTCFCLAQNREKVFDGVEWPHSMMVLKAFRAQS